ncbi:hypothetical protein M011DRAFT_443944 [Sporormia fimetaria CBS 119925]|uniref:Xylanolytic transcriptional activator regulatory domain-containing protein n=1 Tax=Sporormia fimetaria CBS 119925 TaxID=1340428 RepID=A0A6A6VCB6_9PLEO|nr:hypothetical protein M011DRAFT_443944 [Sporormia fimetaria CBS 119925]
MSTMITFAANNEFFRKRKRVHRACEACKKRRKRCSHTFDDQEPDAGSSSKTGHSAQNPSTTDHQPDSHSQDPRHRGEGGHHGYSKSTMQPHSPSDDPRGPTPPNFLGYLNPEAVLREQVHHERGKTGNSPSNPSIGQWVDSHDAERSPTNLPGAPPFPTRLDETGPQVATQEGTVHRALQAYLDAVGVALVPPRKHQEALVHIYFTYVHPLLPIVDKNLFTAWFNEGREPRMLLQAMCIVASKHAEAAEHLLLGDDTRKLGPRDFSQRLYNSVIAGIEAKLEKNRVILIQVLALISLHVEGPDGAEQASMHLAQAIHHAHTFGLQFGHQWKGQKSDSQENLEDLFWCLWSLDKINACMNGRPLLMHDRDNSLTKLPTDPEKRSSPFGIWLQIAEMLDKVIDYYRPGGSADETGWEGDDFLGFEEMVGDGEDKLDGPIMSLLSLFHHAMCMASHKSLSINDPVKSTPSYVRQSLSATRVISLLNAEPPELLPPLPLVPYALSLALSVVYRHFRSRRLKVHINRATEELKQCVMLLNRLRSAWWSAGTMADLGTAVLQNADRNTRTANTPAAAVDAHNQAPRPSDTRLDRNNAMQPPQNTIADPTSSHSLTWDQHAASSIDPSLQPQSSQAFLNHSHPPSVPVPGQHPTSSERGAAVAPGSSCFDFASPAEDWLNFDAAFENFEGLLGSSGADLSNELFRPLNYEMEDF